MDASCRLVKGGKCLSAMGLEGTRGELEGVEGNSRGLEGNSRGTRGELEGTRGELEGTRGELEGSSRGPRIGAQRPHLEMENTKTTKTCALVSNAVGKPCLW